MKKPSLKTFLMTLAVAMVVLLSRNIFDGQIAFGMFVAGAYCGIPVASAVVYLLAGLFFGWNAVLGRLVQISVILILLFVHKFAKRMVKKPMLALYIVASNVFFCLYQYDGVDWLMDKLVAVCAGLAFAFVSVYTLKALFTRGLVYKPTFDELVCISLFATVTSYSMATLVFLQYNLLMFFAPFVILFLLTAFGNQTGLIGAVLFSTAGLFATSDFSQFAVYVLMCLCALSFGKINRFAAGISLVICDVLLAYFFDVYGSFDIAVLLPTTVSVAAFFVLPSKVTQALANNFGTDQQFAGKSIINKLRANLASKLFRLSDVFFSMKSTFVSMTGKALDGDEAKKAIAKQVCDTVCFDCKKRNNCWRTSIAVTEDSFLMLADCAVQSGKATILDITSELSMNCDRLGVLLSNINSQADAYRSYISRNTQTDNSRLLISEQLGGVSRIMQQLASECKGKLTFNSQKEKEIVDKLTFHNILTSEAVFIEQSSGVTIILTVAKRDLDSAVICSVVSHVLKISVRIDKVEPCENASWLAVYLTDEPRFKLTYGIRNCVKAKGTVSGDTHSFIKIDNNKFLLAICDGMGSGENAENVSATTISLVENFYRAGFDSDVILSCTNKLLAGFNSETFTAVDICVVNLANGACDFIKLGASDGLFRSNGEVKYVSGSSLPIGVLPEMRPSNTKAILKNGDYILLASDGFWECFSNPDIVADMLQNVVLTNPQTVADDFMETALTNCKNSPADDVTLVVARIV